jgi:hypothetical protein
VAGDKSVVKSLVITGAVIGAAYLLSLLLGYLIVGEPWPGYLESHPVAVRTIV